jgi:hypothetical protein
MTMIGYDTLPLFTANALASGSTGDKATLKVPPGKWELERSFVVWEGASAHATAAIVAFDIRPTAGSDTGRGSGDAGIVKKVASVAQQGKMTYWFPSTKVFVSGGNEIIVEVTTAQGEALAFAGGVVLRSSPESQVNLANEVLTA